MRIIAGEFRGRRLFGPADDVTRPITDRVKQSLFDILAPVIEGSAVYDCFSGTGSMGLECLSRGASHATFFDADRTAVSRLRQNITTLGVGERTTVIAGDLFKWFAAPAAAKKQVQLIFLDPPYRFLREQPAKLQQWAVSVAETHLAADGIVIFRHDIADNLDLLPLRLADRREYGGMVVELLSRG